MRQLKHFLNPAIAFLFLCIFIYQSQAQELLPQIVKKIEPSTVVIFTYDEEGNAIVQGSGFFISEKGDLITNRHVLEKASRAEVKTAKGKIYSITRVVAEDNEGDLIRVFVDIPSNIVVPYLSVSNSLPETGERVIVIGSPLGLEKTVSDGIVSAVRDIPEFGKIYQITAPVSPGSSGSPVVNMKGEVIGVTTFVMIEGQNLNFAIPGERVAKLKPVKWQSFDKWQGGRAEEKLVPAEEPTTPAVEETEEDLETQIEAYKQAIRLKPDDAESHHNLGVTYGKLGRYNEAIEAYKQAIRLKPDYADAHYNLGLTYDKLGRYNEEIEAYKQAIRLKPDYADAHYNLGCTYGNLGRYNEEIEAYKQAIRLKPDYADAHYNLGCTYGKFGRYNEEIEAYKQAIRLKPDDAEAHYNLGVTYLILGDNGSALDEYKILKDYRYRDG